MSEGTAAPVSPPASSPVGPGNSAVAASLLLSGAALWLALCGFGIIHTTYDRYRGRTDLDMPEWFAINLTLTFKVLPLAALAGLLDSIAVCLFLAWVRQARWLLRVGFVLQWLGSVAVVMLLIWARLA
jgi:hypothetical protein